MTATKMASSSRLSFAFLTLSVIVLLSTLLTILHQDAVQLMATVWLHSTKYSTTFINPDLHQPALEQILQEIHSDPKCRSRAEQSLFHRRSPPPPPPPFEEAWSRYTTLHRSCTVGKNLSAELLSPSKDNCKYLIYVESPAGLGNRLLSLLTAFTYALVTDRVLLVDGRNKMTDLLCEPFESSSWVLPADYPYWKTEADAAARVTVVDDPSAAAAVAATGTVVRLNLNHDRRLGDERFFGEPAQRWLAESAKFVAWSSNQYYVTELFMMPAFFPKLVALFGGGEYMFTYLSRRILLPANDVWGMVVRYYRAYVDGADARTAVQIRLHGPDRKLIASFQEAAQRRIVNCLISHGVLPNATDDSTNSIDPVLSKSETVSLLVAALQTGYARALRKLYIRGSAADGRAVRVHTASDILDVARQTGADDEVRLALAEMWLLAFSDSIATSAYSTFGYVGAGVGAVRPLILNLRQAKHGGNDGNVLDGDDSESCIIGQSFEPCTHYPVKLWAVGFEAVSEEHKAWMRDHVRHCQDQQIGWQLVPNPSSPPLSDSDIKAFFTRG